MITTPDIRVSRSAFMQFVPKVMSWKHGELFVIDSTIVQPGDTLKGRMGSLVRLNTPIAPFNGEIQFEADAFFVPLRLLWKDWKKFFGENENSAGIAQEIDIPLSNGTDADIFANGIAWNSVSAYCGKPIVTANASKHALATLWKEKAYYKVWNEHYRASMHQNPVILSDDPDVIGTYNGSALTTASTLMQVNKSIDVFTAASAEPQAFSSVTLPLGQSAPVSFAFKNGQGLPEDWAGDATTIYADVDEVGGSSGAVNGTLQMAATNSSNDSAAVYGIADLSQATASSINLIRYAFATQRYNEQSLYGGAYFWGQMIAHYGVTPSDASLQRSLRLGTINFKLNVSQVTAMGNTTINGQTAPAGSVGAISVTGNNRSLFTKAFEEHGVLIVLGFTNIKTQTYVQGLLREDTKTKRLDYFTNEFAHVGNVGIKKKELYVTGDSSDEEIFGYQEAWYENRYRPVGVAGVCNPCAGAGVAVDVWSLANNFASRPQLNGTFLQEDRNNVASRLTTGTSSNYDYIGNFEMAYEKITETPLNSQPGLLDHLGDM